jgi:hypothetical protein
MVTATRGRCQRSSQVATASIEDDAEKGRGGMTLIGCSECGHDVRSAAVACPNCGNPISQPSDMAQPTHAPPTSQPTVRPSPPMSLQRIDVRPLSFGLSGTVAGFWWAASVLYALAAFFMFGAWGIWLGFDEGTESLFQMVNSDRYAFGVFGWATLWMWVSGILFIVWFYQAYRSAESHGASGRRWSSGWSIGGWFIPLANLVIPKMVMNEVDRMSNPLAGEPPRDEQWKLMPRSVVSDLWWILFLVGTALWLVGIAAIESEPGYSGPAMGTRYLVLTLSLAFYSAAAALAGVVVLRIGKRLRRRQL